MPEGLDHQVAVRGEVVLRRGTVGGEGLAVADEAALLRVLRTRVSLPVPGVLRTWPARGLMEMQRIPGSALHGRLAGLPPEEAARLAGVLGDFVASVAAIPSSEVAHLVPLDRPRLDELLAEATRTCARIEVLAPIPAATRARLEAFLDTPPPPAPTGDPVLVHGDLGAEHVFVDRDGTVTGIIDWSDAALGDPAVDLGLVLRDLGPPAGETAMARCASHGLGADEMLPRALFHATVRAIEDLAHGIDHDARLYRDNALRALARLL